MKLLDNVMSNMLCCIGYHSSDDTLPPPSSRTTATNKDTPISMSVHGPSVPHTIDSPDALHKIFASNSSMRGYNAVQTRPNKRTPPNGSLDLNFRFGSESPQKPRGRLEQLTHHVKQKLSEGKLSLNGEKRESSTTAPIQLSATRHTTVPDAATKLLGQSQKSLGLTELLASRTGSERGYDSDARSIQTPTIVSTVDMAKNDSKYIYRPLGIIESSQGDERSTESPEMVANLVINPNAFGTSAASRASFTTRIDVSRDLSNNLPADVLQQVNNGASKRNDELSNRSMLHTEQEVVVATVHNLPSLLNLKTRLSHAEGGSASTDVNSKGLESDVDLTKGENDTSVGESNLPAKIHPTLFERPAASSPYDGSSNTSPPTTVVKVGPKSIGDDENMSNFAFDSKKELVKKQETRATTASDGKSLRLFNMRISQRLASNSRIPILSSTNSSAGNSSKSLLPSPPIIDVKSAKSSLSRGPTFIAIESNRRPSDPRTKTLFEPNKPSFRQPNWRRSLSDRSVKMPDGLNKDQNLIVDDSSSFYGSVASGGTDRRELSPLASTTVLLKNQNSLAIGGRSASATVSTRYAIHGGTQSLHVDENTVQPNESCDTSQTMEESFYTPEEIVKGRSVSMPKPSKYIRVDTTPTPMVRKFQFSTEANEDMSEIGIEHINRGRHKTTSSGSTQAIKDRIDENFSETSITSLEAAKHDEAGMRNAWLSQGRRTGWGFDFANSPSKKQLSASYVIGQHSTKQTSFPDDQDDTTQLWRKAFRRVGESVDHGRLLATPQFDREGRRKPSNASVSDQGQQVGGYPLTPIPHRRSQSVDSKRYGIRKDLEMQRNRRKSFPLLTATGSKIAKKKSFPKDKASKLTKKSSELRRRFTNGLTESSPSTDILGIWGRFASHTRDLRNGPAGPIDSVKIRDFESDVDDNPDPSVSMQAARTSPSPTLQSGKSKNRLTVKKPISRQTTKSMSFVLSSAEKAKLRRKGFFGRVRHLYRTKSSELQAYTSIQGHRSSVAPGLAPEYPELEIIGTNTTPESNHHPSGSGLDGVSEQWRRTSLESISEIASRKSRSIHSHTLPWSKKDANEWSKLYQDCVGSLSALRNSEDGSSNTLAISAVNGRRILSLTSVLRDSTVNFEAELKKTADQERETLLRQLQISDEREGDPLMPGTLA